MTLSHIQPGRSPFYKFTAFARTTRSWPCAFARSLLHDNVGYTLQLVAKQAAADEPFLERARLDRMQVPCVPILDPQPSWSVSSPLSARCFRQSVPAAPAAGELGRLLRSLHPDTRLSEKVAQMLQDVCSRPARQRTAVCATSFAGESGEIHRHLLHCSQTPDAVTLKNWLLSFMSAQMSSEDVAALAAEVVASHGAICCFDFLSSDGARTVLSTALS